MQLRHFCRLAAFLAAGFLALLPASATAQTPPDPAIHETLNRVGADLFSPSPNAAAAITELKGILAVEPELAEAHMLLGIAYRAEGSPELMGQAIAELRQALGLKPSLIVARLALARLYLDVSRAARAREELDLALEQAPGHPHLLSLLGEAERQLGDPKRSVELNGQALKADPNFMQARYYRAIALLEIGDSAGAIGDFQVVVKSGMNPAEANLGLGTAYLQAGRVDAAVAPLREAVRADPSRLEAHIQLSRAYRSKGLLAEADKALALAMKSSPAGSTAVDQSLVSDLYMEEGFVRMDQGRLEEAAESFGKVLAADADHEPATQALAEVQKRLKNKARKKPGPRS